MWQYGLRYLKGGELENMIQPTDDAGAGVPADDSGVPPVTGGDDNGAGDNGAGDDAGQPASPVDVPPAEGGEAPAEGGEEAPASDDSQPQM